MFTCFYNSKIENRIGYIRRDFFLGRDFNPLADLNNQAIEWLKRVNSSVHGTTHEIPIERHKLEVLKPIDAVPEYLIIREETRNISGDCYISYPGNSKFVSMNCWPEVIGFQGTKNISRDCWEIF